MTFWKWSRTAADNGTADATCPAPEGWSPAQVNNTVRGLMAAAAKYRDDMAGAIVTTGTNTAYAVSSYQGFGSLSDLDKRQIAFTPHATNADTVTLSVDGMTAKPLRSAPDVELLAGTLIEGSPYFALYNHADGCFYLKGFYSSPFNLPFLGGCDYWDTVSPGSAFIFPKGQAISRTVYARAFDRWGTKFGNGDGTTTFNVPDKTGRVSAMVEDVATRLTTAGSGIDGDTFGAAGGVEKANLSANQIPSHSSSGTNAIAVTSSQTGVPSGADQGNYFTHGTNNGIFGPGRAGASGPMTVGQITSTGNNNILVSYTNASQAPVAAVQPTIICNYIIRIL